MVKAASLCLFVCWVSAQDTTTKPNIVVIFADDLGWNDVGYHGSNEIPTPNIDALAYSGIMLERHYVAPTCTPSRSAFYTGKYPFRIGMQGPPIGASKPVGLPLSETLMPQHLRGLGYATHLVGKWHVGHYTTKHTPTYRGFDSFFGFWHGYIGYYDGIHNAKDLPERGCGMDAHRNTDDAWQEFAGEYITDLLTKEAVNIIQEHNTSKPLYLQVMHLAPHSGNKGQKLEVRDKSETLAKYHYIKDYNRRLFAGMVEALDDSVGQIVASLKAKGLLENSIVVFMSDNGAPSMDLKFNTGNFGSNWPLRGEKISVHEGGVRVPAVIYSPFLSNSNVSEQLFHVSDWLPTLYQAAGGNLTDLGPIDGISQWEALRTRKDHPRQYAPLDIDDIFKQEALIHGHWKVVRHGANTSIDFTHKYYGSSGRYKSVPEYNLTSVVSSPAYRAINDRREPNLLLYRHKRSRGTIDATCKSVVEGKTTEVKDCTHYCLFNIYSDPCETLDISEENQHIVQNLVSVLERLKEYRVSRSNLTVDFRANPKLWDNRWVSWLDPQYRRRFRYVTSSMSTLSYNGKVLLMSVLFSVLRS